MEMAEILVQCRGHRLRGEDTIGDAGGDRTLRHARELGRGRLLHQCQSARSLDGLQVDGAVVIRPAQHDPDAAVRGLLREGAHEIVDGLRRGSLSGYRLVETDHASAQHHQPARRHHLDLPAGQWLPVGEFLRRQHAAAAQQFGQVADVLRRQVRHDDIGDARVVRRRAEQGAQRDQPPGGCPDSNDRDVAGR